MAADQAPPAQGTPRRRQRKAQPPACVVWFGVMAPSLAEQLGVAPSKVETFQKDADAISRLLVKGLIPDSVGSRARRTLLRRVVQSAGRVEPRKKGAHAD